MQQPAIYVTAPPSVRTPIHKEDGIEPGGAQMFVVHGQVREVRFSATTRRLRDRGDLILCDADGKHVDSYELAFVKSAKPAKGGAR